jgi:hypothetical protein
MLKKYLQDIFKTSRNRDATEPSYYPDLKKLLETYLVKKEKIPNITVNPKKTTVGMPDFTVRRGHELIGYIEAKDPKYEDLEALPQRDREQIARYQEKLPNLILTNFFDFWLWRKDEKRWIKTVRIGMPRLLNALKMAPPPQKEDEFFGLLSTFFNFYIPERKSAKSLAEELAGRAQLLRPYIIELLTDNEDEEIDRIYKSFTEFLIPDLTKEDFADIYAQTITYGLFTARLRSKNGKGFNRFEAQRLLPKNLPILYHTFNLISSGALPESLEWLVTEISTVLANADMEEIRKELTLRKGDDDPFIHFYEDFLAAYDPAKREKRGVYYTPFPVVSYITRSINEILKDKKFFGLNEGFADKKVTSLDFASGTLTFPVNSVKIAFSEYRKWNPDLGGVTGFIRNHILKDFYAFELLMAPYVLGHLKASLILEEYNYQFDTADKEDRFNLFLTNTLDFDPVKESSQPFTFYLSEEGRNALAVKKDKRILVVMGNPPYSVSSQNDTAFTRQEMALYKEDVKKERNIQLLSDDYVKFLRFAHWKIEQVGSGIIGVITKNTYLSVSAFKGLRKKLLEFFDDVYVLNLHGKLYEKTSEGKPDQNVFDIRVGVAILFLVKTGTKKGEYAVLHFAELRGDKDFKYKYLTDEVIKTTEWEELEIDKEYFFFEKKEFKHSDLYKKFFKIEEIFGSGNPKSDQGKLWASGIKTNRDFLLTDDNEATLKRRISDLQDYQRLSDQEVNIVYNLKDDNYWQTSRERKKLEGLNIEDNLYPYFYKPFSQKFIYYQPNLIEIGRGGASKHVMKNFFKRNLNLGLVLKKRFNERAYHHCFVTDTLVDINFLSGQTYVFPLYIENGGQLTLEPIPEGNRPNFSENFLTVVKKTYGEFPSPEDIFAYIYTVLHSSVYGEKYLGQLANDFPRIPFTSNFGLFKKTSELGKKLISLHLLKDESLNKPVAGFYGKDSELVKAKATYKDKKLFINDTQYFGEVEKEVWEFRVGGYQVLDKWIKDRVGKYLNEDDIRHVCRVITAISMTIEIQKEINKLYPEIENDLISL